MLEKKNIDDVGVKVWCGGLCDVGVCDVLNLCVCFFVMGVDGWMDGWMFG